MVIIEFDSQILLFHVISKADIVAVPFVIVDVFQIPANRSC
jgi:hypothetical protein